jgi:hypothetical protein
MVAGRERVFIIGVGCTAFTKVYCVLAVNRPPYASTVDSDSRLQPRGERQTNEVRCTLAQSAFCDSDPT